MSMTANDPIRLAGCASTFSPFSASVVDPGVQLNCYCASENVNNSVPKNLTDVTTAAKRHKDVFEGIQRLPRSAALTALCATVNSQALTDAYLSVAVGLHLAFRRIVARSFTTLAGQHALRNLLKEPPGLRCTFESSRPISIKPGIRKKKNTFLFMARGPLNIHSMHQRIEAFQNLLRSNKKDLHKVISKFE